MPKLRLLAPALLVLGPLALLAGKGEARAEAIPLPEVPTNVLPEGVTSRHLVYLNRHGGTYAASAVNDSRRNLSSVVFSNYLLDEASETVQVPPFELGDVAFEEVLRCVRAVYAPFGIEMTDEDPGLTPHIEAVLGGEQEDIGHTSPPVSGVAPISPVCDVVENGIAFSFSKAWQGNLDGICSTTVHEIGHVLGLDHSLTCEDPMSYCHDVGQRFVDVTAGCGEDQDARRPCKCGATQNSVEHLEAKVGLAAEPDRTPPKVTLVGPTSSVTAYGLVEIVIDTDDDVRKVEVLLDGAHHALLGARPFVVTPHLYTRGAHTLLARATDGAGNVGEEELVIEVLGADGLLNGEGLGEDGCAVSGGPGGEAGAPALALLAAGTLARRRRRSGVRPEDARA